MNPSPALPRRALATGCELIAQAAMDAGCRFFAGYPITPASQIFEVLTRELPARGGVAFAAPDEISALAYCLGASMRGARTMTATSGPGFALMVESVGYAVMTETPVVIAMIQRLGPSTGAATQGAQGDIGMVSQAVSGGYTIPVFTASTAEEYYSETARAFAVAERCRTPVVLLGDKEVASTSEVVDLDGLPTITPADRPAWSGQGPFLPYAFSNEVDVPGFVPVGGPQKVTITGSAHDFAGRLKKNDGEVLAVLRHLQAKIEAAEPDLGRVDVDGVGAPTLVLSYGVTTRAAREAVALARANGRRVALANVRTLFPLPVTALAPALAQTQKVVVAEENMTGLYAAALTPLFAGRTLVRVNKLGGLITPREILDAIG